MTCTFNYFYGGFKMNDLDLKEYQINYFATIIGEVIERGKKYIKEDYDSEIFRFKYDIRHLDNIENPYYAETALWELQEHEPRLKRLINLYKDCLSIERMVTRHYNQLNNKDFTDDRLREDNEMGKRGLDNIYRNFFPTIAYCSEEYLHNIYVLYDIKFSMSDDKQNESYLDKLQELGYLKNQFDRDVASYCVQCVQDMEKGNIYVPSELFDYENERIIK